MIADRALARQPRAKATAPHRGLRREFINDVCDLAVLTDVSIAMWRELDEEAE